MLLGSFLGFDNILFVFCKTWFFFFFRFLLFVPCNLLGKYLLIFLFRSISSLLTTTEAVVVELPKDEKEAPGMGGGMGGMDY